MTEDFNHLTSGIEQLEKLQSVRLSIGVPWTNGRLNMITLVVNKAGDYMLLNGKALAGNKLS